MSQEERAKRFGEKKKAALRAYRITWTQRNPLGLWDYNQMIEYAETQSLAVCQALAKIRRDHPHGMVAAAHEVIAPEDPAAPPF